MSFGSVEKPCYVLRVILRFSSSLRKFLRALLRRCYKYLSCTDIGIRYNKKSRKFVDNAVIAIQRAFNLDCGSFGTNSFGRYLHRHRHKLRKLIFSSQFGYRLMRLKISQAVVFGIQIILRAGFLPLVSHYPYEKIPKINNHASTGYTAI